MAWLMTSFSLIKVRHMWVQAVIKRVNCVQILKVALLIILISTIRDTAYHRHLQGNDSSCMEMMTLEGHRLNI